MCPFGSQRRWRKQPGIAAFCGFIATAVAAGAEAPLTLDLSTPEGCPTSDAIVSAVGTLVHETPKSPLHAVARIEHRSDDYVLKLTLEGGERVVTGTSCLELSRTLAVILALAIDPAAKTDASSALPFDTDSRSDAPPANEVSPPIPARPANVVPSPTPTTAPDHAASAARPRPTAPSAPVRFGASLLASGDIGTLPNASYGSTLVGRMRNRVFGLELSLGILAPQWAQLPSAGTRKGGDVWWFGGQLGACWYPSREVDVGACAGFEAGRLTGTGENVDDPRTTHALWLAAVPAASLRLPLSARFSLEGRLALAVAALRPEFGLDGYAPFYEPRAVSGRGAVGIAFE